MVPHYHPKHLTITNKIITITIKSSTTANYNYQTIHKNPLPPKKTLQWRKTKSSHNYPILLQLPTANQKNFNFWLPS